MSPTSRACSFPTWPIAALLAATLGPLASCATASIPEPTRRSPDGVAIDPMSSPPPARDRAEVADGLVTLRTPLGVDRAVSTVEELFRKIVVEDADGLEQLFTRDARAVTSLSAGGHSAQAQHFWQGRFRKLDYTKLTGDLIYREAELTIFRAEDVATELHPAISPESLAPSDVVIRVPIVMPRLGADRLFGDEMILWLRRDGDRYRIFRIMEEFQLN